MAFSSPRAGIYTSWVTVLSSLPGKFAITIVLSPPKVDFAFVKLLFWVLCQAKLVSPRLSFHSGV